MTVVTGANSGIGRAAALALGASGHHVVLAGRSTEALEDVRGLVLARGGSAETLFLDLARFNAVSESAQALSARHDRVDVLINNAGIAGQWGLSPDGFEIQFAVNYLGPVLFTLELLPLLRSAEAPRAVHVSSDLHRGLRSFDWRSVQTSTRPWRNLDAYGHSKLGNVLFASELARREPWLRSYAVHPGGVATAIYRRVPGFIRGFFLRGLDSPEVGARGLVHLAQEPIEADNGTYFDRTESVTPSPLAQNAELSTELWEKTLHWLKRS